jgi:AcrR family transcriptional regulator
MTHYSSGMAIPPPAGSATRQACWASLDATEKRARLLAAAAEVFARDGLNAPMPSIAAAAGAGVGSVYRQFASKEDLLAELVVERLSLAREDARSALESKGDSWTVLVALLLRLAERQAEDDVMGEAMASVSEHPAVRAALIETLDAIEQVLARARRDGRLRADVGTLDVQLLFAGTRAASDFQDGGWRRMLELGLRAFESPARAQV